MTDIIFDKLTYLDRLKSGGFTEEQVRAYAEALDIALRESVATKVDLRELETRVVKWLVPLLLGQAALVVTLVKLL